MTAHVPRFVVALTRLWLRAYTSRLPADVSQMRRHEVESDIWEMQHDVDFVPGIRSSCIALARLLDGIPDDLAWRFENAAEEEQLMVRRLFAVAVAFVLVVSLWTVPSLFVSGQDDVVACAAEAPTLQTNADLRLEVMRCAGAFFSASR